jgi:hypothetical protein
MPSTVAGDSGEGAVAGGLPAVLGHGGLAEHDRALLSQPRHCRSIEFLRSIRCELGAEARCHALDVDVVLDADRHAVDEALRVAGHPARLRLLCRGQRTGGIEVAVGVDDRIEPFDARQRRPHRLQRREALGTVERDELGGGEEGRVGWEVHRGYFCWR